MNLWRRLLSSLQARYGSRIFVNPSCGGHSIVQRYVGSDRTGIECPPSSDDATQPPPLSQTSIDKAHWLDGCPNSMPTRTSSDHVEDRTKSRVLVIDDEECIRDLVRVKLTREGREVLLATRGEEGFEIFRRERPDITILDLHMPGMSGLEVLRRIRALDPQAIVMVFTGCETQDILKEAVSLGVTEILQKGESLSIVWEGRRRRLL